MYKTRIRHAHKRHTRESRRCCRIKNAEVHQRTTGALGVWIARARARACAEQLIRNIGNQPRIIVIIQSLVCMHTASSWGAHFLSALLPFVYVCIPICMASAAVVAGASLWCVLQIDTYICWYMLRVHWVCEKDADIGCQLIDWGGIWSSVIGVCWVNGDAVFGFCGRAWQLRAVMMMADLSSRFVSKNAWPFQSSCIIYIYDKNVNLLSCRYMRLWMRGLSRWGWGLARQL